MSRGGGGGGGGGVFFFFLVVCVLVVFVAVFLRGCDVFFFYIFGFALPMKRLPLVALFYTLSCLSWVLAFCARGGVPGVPRVGDKLVPGT